MTRFQSQTRRLLPRNFLCQEALLCLSNVSIADATLASPQRRWQRASTSRDGSFQSQTRRLLPRNQDSLFDDEQAVCEFQSQTRRLLPRNTRGQIRVIPASSFQSQTRRLLPRNTLSSDAAQLGGGFQSQTRRLLPRNESAFVARRSAHYVSIADATLASPQR